MKQLPATSQLYFREAQDWPLGQISQAGLLRQGAGTGLRHMRVFGQYALVLVLAGRGRYLDALGHRTSIQPGQLIQVFPDVAHAYGPEPGNYWDELFLCFRGPLFDLWRAHGILDHNQPVCRVPDLDLTVTQMLSLAQAPHPTNNAENMALLGRMQILVAGWLPPPALQQTVPSWLSAARTALSADLDKPLDWEHVCRKTGLSYENLRKAFRKSTGVSPGQFRLQQRIAAAQNLLARTEMTHAAVATHLGFQDEAHFSRRFKQVTGHSPRSWKQLNRQ